jgi:hypothetical protein
VFCETRPLAEEWTFRFLGAALAHHLDEPDDPTAPREWQMSDDGLPPRLSNPALRRGSTRRTAGFPLLAIKPRQNIKV